MNDREKIVERVKKLLALRIDRGASEAEMEAAAALAARLMAKYSIDERECHRMDEQLREETVYVAGRLAAEDGFIAGLLNDHVGVSFIQHRRGGQVALEIVGFGPRVEVALHLYHYLRRSYRRLWSTRVAMFRRSRRRLTGVQLSYYMGLTLTLRQRMKDQRQEVVQSQPDPVAAQGAIVAVERDLKEAIEKKYGPLKKRRDNDAEIDDEAASYGAFDGENVALHDALPGARA